MEKPAKTYEAPKLVPKYEPPVLLDLEQFVTVAGSCSTGGGSCSGSGYTPGGG
ncbi:hypothetical protein Mterra_00195 [Calidithermus terrae]|uniref:Uncharacterized protein n=3 Tax=Calidithermus TaxID=2747271 RepID=A0A399EM16_9DEIN|nr:hypothetical protein [Calidithermus terrae]RIH84099.1 hypothetical protein Mrose_02775 [Calidithermus roseus]RIH90701.1 hypothetical protein Mterra_00195 [Calidithermus terrae]